MSVLELRDVTVDFGRRRALAEFSGVVATGEWLGVIGPNGAGKSSLLRSIAGLVDHGGTIEVGGRSLADMSARERARQVAYVPQAPLIPGSMTALDYVLLGRTPYVGYFDIAGDDDHAIVDDVMDRLRLTSFASRFLGALSGGERQRVVLARALAQQAPVLLLDEPTSALDIGHQQQALELITELRRSQELTVVSAMHDLTLAATYTDRLVMLHDGEVVAAGEAREVITAERLGDVFHVCVSVDIDPEDGTVIVVPRRGFPVRDV